MQSLKDALRRLAKAVVVITSVKDGTRHAMTATAVCELSMEPPSMLICVNRTASIYPVLSDGAPFAINILHHGQEDVAGACAGKLKGEDRFSVGTWTSSGWGVPVLADAQASLVCRNEKRVDHGSHSIFIGEVTAVLLEGIPEPLVYLDGRFSRVLEAGHAHG